MGKFGTAPRNARGFEAERSRVKEAMLPARRSRQRGLKRRESGGGGCSRCRVCVRPSAIMAVVTLRHAWSSWATVPRASSLRATHIAMAACHACPASASTSFAPSSDSGSCCCCSAFPAANPGGAPGINQRSTPKAPAAPCGSALALPLLPPRWLGRCASRASEPAGSAEMTAQRQRSKAATSSSLRTRSLGGALAGETADAGVVVGSVGGAAAARGGGGGGGGGVALGGGGKAAASTARPLRAAGGARTAATPR